MDFLSTTPERLLKTIEVVLDAYDKNKSRENLLGETAQIMNPDVIRRLRDLQHTIRSKHM